MFIKVDNLGDGKPYAFFNNITFTAPKVPILYTALTTGELAQNPAVYGEFTHPFVLQQNQVIEVVVNNIGRSMCHLAATHLLT
jgi:iron transport multicopper oxidase